MTAPARRRLQSRPTGLQSHSMNALLRIAVMLLGGLGILFAIGLTLVGVVYLPGEGKLAMMVSAIALIAALVVRSLRWSAALFALATAALVTASVASDLRVDSTLGWRMVLDGLRATPLLGAIWVAQRICWAFIRPDSASSAQQDTHTGMDGGATP